MRRWADEMLALSPTALRFLKQSFNVDTEHLAGVGPARVLGARAVRRVGGGEGGHPRVHGEAPAGLLAVPGRRVRLAGEAADDRARDRKRDAPDRKARHGATAAHEVGAAILAAQLRVEPDRNRSVADRPLTVSIKDRSASGSDPSAKSANWPADVLPVKVKS